MIRTLAIFCGFTGLIAVLLAIMSIPRSGDVEARETQFSDDGCATREVALDEGYGISRKVMQRICAHED